ncbi:amidohydrolase family protein [Streptomyces sp. NPDC047042]|uniref:amidohydrolase family protein n=1 Tax=Streptomyces sp. NPDC047042 TaxID=3154807 RepID=UPI0033F35F38
MSSAAAPVTTVLRADRLVTGERGTVIPGGCLVVRDDVIQWVGPADTLPAERCEGAVIVDLPGVTLLPGLIEAHTHLSLDGGPRPFEVLASADDEAILDGMRGNARRMLAAGITTGRDLGAPRHLEHRLAAEIARGATAGPTLSTSGIPLTVPGGHLDMMGGACTDEPDIDALIAENREFGATWTKVVVTGGFLTGGTSPYRSQLPPGYLKTAVALSHERGMRVAVHVHGTEGVREAVAAGVDTIEHCTWMTEDGFDLDPALLGEMAAAGVAVSVTVNSRARLAAGALPWRERRSHLDRMVGAGVRIAVGTDSGIGMTAHDDLPRSLDNYRDLDLSCLGVIELATGGTARALGLEHTVGSLAAGLRADVIGVQGDPLTDLQTLAAPCYVMAAGRTYKAGD